MNLSPALRRLRSSRDKCCHVEGCAELATRTSKYGRCCVSSPVPGTVSAKEMDTCSSAFQSSGLVRYDLVKRAVLIDCAKRDVATGSHEAMRSPSTFNSGSPGYAKKSSH